MSFNKYVMTAVTLVGIITPAPAQTTTSPTNVPKPEEVRAVMKRVADWQLVNPSASSNRYTEDAWTWGAFYTGTMA